TDHNITFNFELDPCDPQLLADKIQIEQVLLNLVRNAIEAYSECKKTYRPVIITTRLASGYICISVQDEGNGISAEGLDTLFEPFITSKSTGLGMGLAISQTIIETHGGQLWAESDGKNGTQFHFKVPVRTS
ncbi:MAG: sensor histidine kinase, partial [Pseudomonadales bacterium]